MMLFREPLLGSLLDRRAISQELVRSSWPGDIRASRSRPLTSTVWRTPPPTSSESTLAQEAGLHRRPASGSRPRARSFASASRARAGKCRPAGLTGTGRRCLRARYSALPAATHEML